MKFLIVISFLVNFQLVLCQPKTQPLKVLVREFEPYAILDGDGVFRKGIDIIMMDTIAKKLEVKVQYRRSKEHSVANIGRLLGTKYSTRT